MMERWLLEGADRRSLPNRETAALKPRGADILTRREAEILTMVAVGSTNDEIADELCISPKTVKAHLYNTFKKINVTSRLQATLWTAENL
jgi:DNA-binding NarL/FixJ family response regulator